MHTRLDATAHGFAQWLESPRAVVAILLLIFFLGVVVRSIPLQFDAFSDPDAFFHARMAQQIVDTHATPVWDALSEQGRVYSYPPLLHVLIAAVSIFSGLPVEIAYKWIGILVGALFGVSVFLLAKHVSKSNGIALAAALFAVLSGISVLRSNGFIRPDGLAGTLIPFILVLWLQRRSVMALILSILLVLIHPLSAAVFAVMLGLWFVVALLRRESVSPLIPVALAGMLALFFAWMWIQHLDFTNYASHVALTASEFSRFEMIDLFFLFPLAWAFLLVALARWKSIPLPILIWFCLTLAIGLFGTRLMVFLLPFYAIISGIGFFHVLDFLHREEKAIAVFGVLFLVLGVITVFLLMSFAHPYFLPGEKAATQWLFAYAQPGEAVFSMWDDGHALAYSTHLPQVVDGYFEFAHELEERITSMWAIHLSSNCDTFSSNMQKFNTTYVFLGQRELEGQSTRFGILELQRCQRMRIPYSSDHARVIEYVGN